MNLTSLSGQIFYSSKTEFFNQKFKVDSISYFDMLNKSTGNPSSDNWPLFYLIRRKKSADKLFLLCLGKIFCKNGDPFCYYDMLFELIEIEKLNNIFACLKRVFILREVLNLKFYNLFDNLDLSVSKRLTDIDHSQEC
ncbi:MAG: hypothetical protein ACK452_11740, partial [Bacteroidota bacterium]